MANKTDEAWPFRDSDRHCWPPPTQGNAEYAKQLDEAKLEVRKKRTDEEIATTAANRGADLAVMQAYCQAILDTAKGSIDRARASADIVQKAAAAIATIYAAILGVSFSVSDRPLPVRGIFAAVLLGLAIFLSTSYLAFLRDAQDESQPPQDPLPSDTDKKTRMIVSFVRWTRAAALDRAPLLRASVVALGLALAFLPAPFVTLRPAPSAQAAVAWPQPQNAGAADQPVELSAILYQAQVDAAVAAQATRPIAVDRLSWLWWVFFAAALAVVAAFGSTGWVKRRRARAGGGSNPTDSPLPMARIRRTAE